MSFLPFPTIFAALSTAGAVVSGLSQIQAAQYQAAVAERNRKLFEENARQELMQSQQEQADWGVSAREQLGNLASELAASGVSGGSASARMRSANLLARRDNARINEEGVNRANAQYQAAADAQGQANMARSSRNFALFSTGLSALDSYIGGATQVRRMKGLVS